MLVFAWASLVWMTLEGAVGLLAGVSAGSIALIGWALGSVIEGLASLIVIWRFTGRRELSETSERTAQREIKDAYDNWKSSAERYQSLEKAVHAAQENFTLQSQEYKRRLVSNLDVLDALRQLFETKRDFNQAFYEAKKNYWNLEVAQGHCCGEE